MQRVLNRTDKTRAEWTANNVVNLYEEGTVVLENAVQRGFVWDVKKKSLLISSLIAEDPIPPIYAAKYGDKYSLIDGKQRTDAIVGFFNGKYALEDLESVVIYEPETNKEEEINVNGLYFAELPEAIQEAIKMSTLTVIIINEPSDDKVCEIFYKLNNGKPLNAITVTRVKAKARKDITELGSHELFKNSLTAKAFERYTNEDIVVKSWAVLHEDEPSLETKCIRPLMEKIEFSSDDKTRLVECYDRILEVHKMIEDKKIAKRIITRTHMISIMRVVWKSIEDGKSTNEFMEWFISFFSGKKSATISSIYNSAAGAGSARKDAVKKRLGELDKNYSDYFKLETQKEVA